MRSLVWAGRVLRLQQQRLSGQLRFHFILSHPQYKPLISRFHNSLASSNHDTHPVIASLLPSFSCELDTLHEVLASETIKSSCDRIVAATDLEPADIVILLVSFGKYLSPHAHLSLIHKHPDINEILQTLIIVTKRCRVHYSTQHIAEAIASLRYYPNVPATDTILDAL